MKKLRLQLGDLRVESFDTTRVTKGGGTVFGEQCTCYTNCTCPGYATCDDSCEGSCAATCAASCYGGSCIGGTACQTDWAANCPHAH